VVFWEKENKRRKGRGEGPGAGPMCMASMATWAMQPVRWRSGGSGPSLSQRHTRMRAVDGKTAGGGGEKKERGQARLTGGRQARRLLQDGAAVCWRRPGASSAMSPSPAVARPGGSSSADILGRTATAALTGDPGQRERVG
jgi:hypothetical protein